MRNSKDAFSRATKFTRTLEKVLRYRTGVFIKKRMGQKATQIGKHGKKLISPANTRSRTGRRFLEGNIV